MKSFTLTRQHYELLWTGSISTVILILIFVLMQEDLFRESTIERNWKIVHDESASKTDRVNALQYLAKERESLSGLDFSGEKSLLQGLNLSPEVLDIKTGIKIGTKHTNLTNVNFSNADLSDANLSDTDLSGANLSGANFTRARLHNVDFSNANLSGTNLSGASLSGTNLSGAKLIDTKLYATKLISTNLSDANLSNADLFAVDFTFAQLDNIILNEKTVMDYTFFWRNTNEEYPTIYLPTGTPRNWDTTLKPDYVCSKNYMSVNVDTTRAKIKKQIEKRCKPYVHREETEISQEETDAHP